VSQVLYLDTARLGQISTSAKRALNAALEFNKAYGASAYFDAFLYGGSSVLKDPCEFGDLSNWRGIDQFKQEIKHHFFGGDDGGVVFANRTASLMSLASKMLFARCRNVLVTDLNWKSFNPILNASVPNENCCVTEVRVKDLILNQGASSEEIIQLILAEYFKHGCDGLFLPAVSNHGIHLPVKEVIDTIKSNAKLRFSVVDAAQAINHVDIGWARGTVDFIFGGTHKWLRSYEPMAFGYFGKPSSLSFISDSIDREMNSNPLADSLMRISQSPNSQIEETVNLCPLFAASGALHDAEPAMTASSVNHQVRGVIEDAAARAGWSCVEPSREFQGRILLLKQPRLKKKKSGDIRKELSRFGVAATDYPGGICRISLPGTIAETQVELLEKALSSIN
jgi:hypothetical protein